MANRRTLKRNINLTCEELLAECVAVSLYNVNDDRENAEALLHAIVALCSDYVCRVSHVEPGMAPKAYFKNLCETFNKSVEDIVDHINNLH